MDDEFDIIEAVNNCGHFSEVYSSRYSGASKYPEYIVYYIPGTKYMTRVYTPDLSFAFSKLIYIDTYHFNAFTIAGYTIMSDQMVGLFRSKHINANASSYISIEELLEDPRLNKDVKEFLCFNLEYFN